MYREGYNGEGSRRAEREEKERRTWGEGERMEEEDGEIGWRRVEEKWREKLMRRKEREG